MEVLRQSNALFGYEGDKYYFDIDIRKHFGLDKFNSDVIPTGKQKPSKQCAPSAQREFYYRGR